MSLRLSLALDQSAFSLPVEGRIGVFHPRADHDLSMLPRDRVVVVQPQFPDHAVFAAQGYDCTTVPDGRFAAVLVCLPRAKAQARDLIARAMAQCDGPVIVDGTKTDGIDSLFRDLRKRLSVSEAISKAHGKLFWMQADPDALTEWCLPDGLTADGFVTAPGVFSADGVDPASHLLAETLPLKPGRHLIDLGAGWGFLSARALARCEGIERIDLVESDRIALDCARRNVTDPRAAFHWADATDWTAKGGADTVLMNPPFHVGRAADPGLGKQFIAAAARLLAPSGHLWMVANRHLPYETTLAQLFADVREVAGDARFKVLQATRPSRPRRR